MTTEIIIFAVSFKHKNFCVSGLMKNSQWIRPISEGLQGALNTHEILLDIGRIPEKLDVIEIEIEKNKNDKLRPEEFYITKKKWRFVRKASLYDIAPVFEMNHDLWFVSPKFPNKIYVDDLTKRKNIDSICSIIVDSYTILFEKNIKKGAIKFKKEIAFSYQGIDYLLPITDYDFINKTKTLTDNGNVIQHNNQAILSISLTSLLNDYCFKVVAGIINL